MRSWIGGYIISLVGDTILVILKNFQTIEFEILDADPRKIILVKIHGVSKINQK